MATFFLDLILKFQSTFLVSQIVFPENFFWGTSLSSHQSEGGNTNSWTQWESEPGHIKNNDRSGLAAGHWNLYESDFDKLNWLNANAHRLSIEWSRVEPEEGRFDYEALKIYRKMVRALRDRGIEPIVCLFHFTLPLWISERGGFEDRKNTEAFSKFVEVVHGEIGDLVTYWLTVNEPVVYSLAAYGVGLTPPGKKDLELAFKVVAELVRAHGLAYRTIKNLNPKAQISCAKHFRSFAPASRFSPLDRWATRQVDYAFNWAWFDAINTGRFEIHMPFMINLKVDVSEALDTLDFLGVNYYSRDHLSINFFSPQRFLMTIPEGVLKSDMGWEIFPEGLGEILTAIKDRGLGNLPIMITENGLADRLDVLRSKFIFDHVSVFLQTSKKLGLKPIGYLHWSLIDNFEWIDGFGPRFGLFEVDYSNQKRTPRESASYFRKLGLNRALSPP